MCRGVIQVPRKPARDDGDVVRLDGPGEPPYAQTASLLNLSRAKKIVAMP